MYTQTQTKIYKFSDKGIEVNGWAKGYYPEVFKKIFVTGYNENLITDIETLNGKVTLILPTNHGYLLERVIRFSSPSHTKDYVITEVTATSISFYDETFPNQITNPISIKIAPLDYELVYEVGQVHIYKFKDLDNTDLFLRLYFLSTKNNSSFRGLVYPCVGKTYDPATGYITDGDSLVETRDLNTPATRFSWELGQQTNMYYDNQPLNSTLGQITIIGSLYHLLISSSIGGNKSSFTLSSILPIVNCVVGKTLPMMTGSRNDHTIFGPSNTFDTCYQYINNYKVSNFSCSTNIPNYFGMPSYLVDPFHNALGISDRMSLNGITLYLTGTSVFFANAIGAHYLTAKTNDNRFVNNASSYPLPIMDSDNFIKSYLCPLSDNSVFCGYVAPMEEIHLGYKV